MLGRPAVDANSTIARPRKPRDANPRAASAAISAGTSTGLRHPVASSRAQSHLPECALGFSAAIQVSELTKAHMLPTRHDVRAVLANSSGRRELSALSN